MKSQTMTRILTIISLVIILTSCNSAIHDRERVLTKLEKYKTINSTYPKTLEELQLDLKTNFYYQIDSAGQTFTLSYTSGPMNVNTMKFDHKTKKWTKQFAY